MTLADLQSIVELGLINIIKQIWEGQMNREGREGNGREWNGRGGIIIGVSCLGDDAA